MTKNLHEQSQLRQRIIVKQNKRIALLELQNKELHARLQSSGKEIESLLDKVFAIKKATLWQRVFNWGKLCK